jgi:hypothetical protein
MEQDRHTVALSAVLLPDNCLFQRLTTYVMVKNASAGALRDGAGVIRTGDGAAITTVLPNVPFSLPATPALMKLIGLVTRLA